MSPDGDSRRYSLAPHAVADYTSRTYAPADTAARHTNGGRATLLFRALPREPKLTTLDKRELKSFATLLSQTVAAHGDFLCLITNDRELHRLNHSFLGHDYPTDVLSFPTKASNGDLGEMAISARRAEAQAAEFGHSYLDEIRILMLHGVLHLIGLDHEHDRGEMARAERKWRTAFRLPTGLIARSRRRRGTGKL